MNKKKLTRTEIVSCAWGTYSQSLHHSDITAEVHKLHNLLGWGLQCVII